MKKTLKILSLLLVLAVMITAFASCDFINNLLGKEPGEDPGKNPEKTTATVTWYNGETVLKTEEVDKGSVVKSWTPEASEGFRFYAWYKDAALTTMFNFNDPINADTAIYGAFVSVDFVADNTEYYLIGDGKGDLATSVWDHANSMFDFVLANQNVPGANVFSITIKMFAGDRFQICHDGLWDGQAGIGYMEGVVVEGDRAVVKDEFGIEVFFAPKNEYHEDPKQWDVTLAEGQDGVYKFTYTTDATDPTKNVLTWELVEKLDPSDAPVAACDIYFIGTFNEWSTTYDEVSDYRLFDNENGTWEGTIEITIDMYREWTINETADGSLCAAIKLYDAANDKWIGYNGDGNLFLKEGVYNIVYDVASNSFTCEIVVPGEIVEGGAGGGSVTGTTSWYVRGSMNGWGAEADYLLTYDEDGNASITLTLNAGDTFKVADAAWTEGVQFNASHLSGNANFKAAATDGNIEVVTTGTYTITVTAEGGFKIVGEGQEDTPVDPVDPVEPTDITIYYYTTEWTSVYLYTFANHTTVGAEWPGVAMTAVEGKDGWYSLTVTVSPTGLYVIFNNNAGSQTADLAHNGLNFWVGGTGYETLEEAEASLSDPSVSSTQWYVKGTMNNWSDNADYLLAYDADGNASLTLTLAVGDIFKVANSDWSLQYNITNINDTVNFKEAAENQNIEVVVGGEYKITVNTSGALVIELIKATEGGEGNEGGETPVDPEVPTAATTVYLVPNDNWNIDGARFAVYMWDANGKSTWVDMVAVEGEENLYSAEIPAGYVNIIFCRMNPNVAANDWTNKWNQTADIALPTDGTNCYTVEVSTWDNGNGTWSTYAPVVE